VSDFGVAVATGWTALRGAVIAPLAVAAAGAIVAELRRTSPSGRRWLWGLLLASILSPDLVAGYGYRNFSLSLARHPAWNEAFLTLLIGLKATAVAAVMLYFTPDPALAPSGRHLLKLGRVDGFERWRLLAAHGSFARILPALAISFLFAFQEFELPSLTGATAWTVTLFDRQAMLPDLADSADPVVWPLAVELLAFSPFVVLVLRSVARSRRAVGPSHVSRIPHTVAWSIAVLIAALTMLVPFAILVREGASSFGYVATNAPNVVGYWREVAIAAGYGMPSGVVAFLVATGLLGLIRRRNTRAIGTALLVLGCIPGLCGALVPSLVAVEWLQSPPWLALRDSLVPLIAVLGLFLLPRAVLLEALANLARDGQAIHLARELRTSPVSAQKRAGRALLWRLDGFGRFCRVSLLAYWGYLDLTAATILAPPGVVPVTARLYNLMHYGHNAALSAMTLVAVLLPLAGFLTLLAARRLLFRVVR
jgi:ABC-type Fe3+ transport system permease subunit